MQQVDRCPGGRVGLLALPRRHIDIDLAAQSVLWRKQGSDAEPGPDQTIDAAYSGRVDTGLIGDQSDAPVLDQPQTVGEQDLQTGVNSIRRTTSTVRPCIRSRRRSAANTPSQDSP
jgi:hypothetical protein